MCIKTGQRRGSAASAVPCEVPELGSELHGLEELASSQRREKFEEKIAESCIPSVLSMCQVRDPHAQKDQNARFFDFPDRDAKHTASATACSKESHSLSAKRGLHSKA